MHLHVYVSAAAGLICLAAAILFWWRGKHQTPRLCVGLMIGAGVGLAASQIGGWVHGIDTWIDNALGDLAGRLISIGPLVIALIIAGWATYEVIVHIRHREISWRTLALGALLPILDAAVPGALGTWLMFTIDAIAWLVTAPVAYLIGLA